ncbi:MAG: TolC family protein [Kiritimatiellia bacterium]
MANWKWAGSGAVWAAVWAAGCVGVPDAQEMQALRAEKSEIRLLELSKNGSAEGSAYLSGELSLADAVAKAMELNLSLRQARLEREISRGRIQESYAEVLPGLALTGDYVRRDEELGTTQADGTYRTTRYPDQYGAGLKLTQPLFNGRIGAALRTAKLYRTWAELGIRQSEENLRYETTLAYYDAVLSDHLLDVNLSALETAERQLADTQARRRQGMASNYDELRAQVEVSNFRAQVLQARNSKDVAQTALFRLIGASPASDVRLVDAIPMVVEDIGFEAALGMALERRADLAEAEYAVRMQRESVAAARSRYVPEVSGYALQEWANPDPHDSSRDEWGDEWQAGVQLSLPLFDGMDRRGALIQERAKLRQYEIALRDAEEKAISQIRQLVLSLKTAEEFANSQSQNLETAKEALRLVETGLKEGQNTPVEVMDARQALTTASANYYKSLFDHAMARVSLQKAMGLLSEGALPDAAVLGAGAETGGGKRVWEDERE